MFLPAHQRILLEYLPASSSSSSSSLASYPPSLPTPQTSVLCAVKKTGPGPLPRRRGGVKEAKSAHLEAGSLTGAWCVLRGAAAGVRVVVSGTYHSGWYGLLSRTEIYIT